MKNWPWVTAGSVRARTARIHTITGCIHISPDGTHLIISLVHHGPITRTFSVLRFYSHTITISIRGILHSTITGTRGGGNLHTSGLIITTTCISRNPALGHVHPHTGNSTSHVLGHASRVAIIITPQGRTWDYVNRGICPANFHLNVARG